MPQSMSAPLWERLSEPPITRDELMETLDASAYDAVYAPVSLGNAGSELIATFILESEGRYFTVDGLHGDTWDVEINPTDGSSTAERLVTQQPTSWNDVLVDFSSIVGTLVNDTNDDPGFGSLWLVVGMHSKTADEVEVDGTTVYDMNVDVCEPDTRVLKAIPTMGDTLENSIEVEDIIEKGPEAFTIDDVAVKTYSYPATRMKPANVNMDQTRKTILAKAFQCDPYDAHEGWKISSDNSVFREDS